MEEIFNKKIEEFIETNKRNIIKKIDLNECNYIIKIKMNKHTESINK